MPEAPQNLTQLEGEESILGIPFTLEEELTVILSKEGGSYCVGTGGRRFSMDRIDYPVSASPKSPGTMFILGETNARSDDGIVLTAAIGNVHIRPEEAASAVRQLMQSSEGESIHLEVPCTLTSAGITGVLSDIMGKKRSREENCSIVFAEETP